MPKTLAQLTCAQFITNSPLAVASLIGGFLLVLAGRAEEPGQGKNSVEPSERDVAYGPHERHRLDLWRAKATEPTPLLVFIHGGGWNSGDKADIPAELLQTMLAHGVSVASINYRYSRMAIVPGPLRDGARAIQFLRTKARAWNLDPKRIGAMGISAGGCTALWLAFHDDLADSKADSVLQQSSRLRVAVGLSPQTSLDPKEAVAWIGDHVLSHPMIARAAGVKDRAELLEHYDELAPRLREASPIQHVSRGDPPVLVSFPTMGALPAPDAGSAIHHAMFGVKLKEKADAVGARCVLRIEDRVAPGEMTPEQFLLAHLGATTSRATRGK